MEHAATAIIWDPGETFFVSTGVRVLELLAVSMLPSRVCHTCQVSRIFRDYPGIEAIIPDPGLHADFPGIQANLPGSRILRKNTTLHTGMASCARIFCRTALQCSQVRARQRP